MTNISGKIQALEESQTLLVTQRARKMKESGIDVAILTVGESDFPTPRHIKEAAIRAIEADFTHYTPNEGTPELITAVIDKFAAENGLQFEPGQVLISSGAKQSIFNALRALLNPGDEVVIPAPYWVSYPAMVRLADGVPVIVPMPAAGGFRPDLKLLRKAIGPKTRALILNTPVNPTGVVYTKSELQELAAIILETGITAISDEIYEKVIFDGRPHVSIGSFKSVRERVVTVNGMSKAYAMTGWRIGYMGGPEALVRAAAKVQGQITNNANSIAQKAAVAALRGPRGPVEDMTAELERRRNYTLDRLATVPEITLSPPQGAMFAFFSVAPFLGRRSPAGFVRDASAIASFLLERHQVAVVPGDAFGTPACIRLSFACAMKELEQGLDRLIRGLHELQ